MAYEFEQYEGDVANAFVYRGVPVRFTYLVDIVANHVGEMDVDVLFPGDTQEKRLGKVRGPWKTRDEGLADAKSWAAAVLNKVLDSEA